MHTRFSDSKEKGSLIYKIIKGLVSPLFSTDERALTLVRDVTDTDRRLTVRDTAEMCDLKRTALQSISKVGVQTLEAVYSGRRRKVLKRKETFKSSNISSLHRDVKNRHIAAPRMPP